MTLNKPGHTMPCNGCGLCCKEEVCAVGEAVFKDPKPPCPALKKRKGIYRCGVVLLEAHYPIEKMFARALGIGMGCCANDAPLLTEAAEK